MNTNRKKLKLVKEGIKASTLNKMSDKQVDMLYNRLLEQVTTVSEPAKTAYKVGEKGGNLPPSPKGYNVKKNPDGTVTAMPNEMEMKEEEDFNLIQDPDASADGMGMFEEEEVDEKKKETKESYKDIVGSAYNKIMASKLGQMGPKATFSESEIEKQILKLVEKHITPKMTKKDFLNLIEGDTKTAPSKPKEKERVKPKHPFKPDPNKKGAPKAKKTEMDEDTKTAPAKPKVSPGVKPKHPFKPDPDKKGAPKADKKELPSFLTYKALGLNLK